MSAMVEQAGVPHAALVGATVCNGLTAGLFFAFSCAVSPALRRVDDQTSVVVFRAINRAILNPAFLLVFAGAPALSLAATVLELGVDHRGSLGWVLGGTACSVLSFAITAARNVPLNTALERAQISAPSQRQLARRAFEARWNRWNLARTASSTAALALLAVAATR